MEICHLGDADTVHQVHTANQNRVSCSTLSHMESNYVAGDEDLVNYCQHVRSTFPTLLDIAAAAGYHDVQSIVVIVCHLVLTGSRRRLSLLIGCYHLVSTMMVSFLYSLRLFCQVLLSSDGIIY